MVLMVKSLPANAGHKRCWFDPWIRKISWRRKWQRTPIFLPGKYHGQRSLVGYSPRGPKELDTTEQLIDWAHTHTRTIHQWAKWLAQRHHDSSKAGHKGPKSGQWPNSWKSLPLPQNSWNNPLTHYPNKNWQPPTFWDGPFSVCGVSPWINLSFYDDWLLSPFPHEAKNPRLAAILGTCLGRGKWPFSHVHFLYCNSMN